MRASDGMKVFSYYYRLNYMKFRIALFVLTILIENNLISTAKTTTEITGFMF